MGVKAIKQIKKDNLDAEIIVLQKKVEEKQIELHEIALREQTIKDDRISLDKDREAFKKEQEEGKKAHDIIRATTVHLKGTVEKDIEIARESLRQVQEKVKEEEKRLARLNSSCLNAQEDIRVLLERTVQAQKDLEILTRLVLRLEETKLIVKTIENQHDILTKEFSSKQQAQNIELEKMKAQVDYLTQESATKIEEARKAKDMYNMYATGLQVAMNDWLVMRARLETRFKEHYPELELPIRE